MVGYVKKDENGNLIPETTAGPAGGTIDALLETQDKDYALVLGEGKEGESFVGFSGQESLSFNPVKGNLTVKCVHSTACCSDASCKVDITSKSDNVEYSLPFIAASASTNGPNRHTVHKDSDAKLTYNPGKNALTTDCFCGTSTCSDVAKKVDYTNQANSTTYTILGGTVSSTDSTTEVKTAKATITADNIGSATLSVDKTKTDTICSSIANTTPVFTPETIATSSTTCCTIVTWDTNNKLVKNASGPYTKGNCLVSKETAINTITNAGVCTANSPMCVTSCSGEIRLGNGTKIYAINNNGLRYVDSSNTGYSVAAYKCVLPKTATSADYWKITTEDDNAIIFGQVYNTYYTINKQSTVLGAYESAGNGADISVASIDAKNFWLSVASSSAVHTLWSNSPIKLASSQTTAPSGVTFTKASRLSDASTVTCTAATASANRNILLGETTSTNGSSPVYVSNACKLTYNPSTGALCNYGAKTAGYQLDLTKPGGTVRYVKVKIIGAVTDCADTYFTIDDYTDHLEVNTAIVSNVFTISEFAGSGAYGSWCIAPISGVCDCFWLRYGGYRSPRLNSHVPMVIEDTTTAAPTGVTWTAPKPKGVVTNVTVNGVNGTVNASTGAVTVSNVCAYMGAGNSDNDFHIPYTASNGAVAQPKLLYLPSTTCPFTYNPNKATLNVNKIRTDCIATCYSPSGATAALEMGVYAGGGGYHKVICLHSVAAVVDGASRWNERLSYPVSGTGTCSDYKIPFVSDNSAISSCQSVYVCNLVDLTASRFTYNPSTGNLNVPQVTGNLCGTAHCTYDNIVNTSTWYTLDYVADGTAAANKLRYISSNAKRMVYNPNTATLALVNGGSTNANNLQCLCGCIQAEWLKLKCGICAGYDISIYCQDCNPWTTCRTAYIYCDGSACFNGNVCVCGTFCAKSIPIICRSGTNMIVCL